MRRGGGDGCINLNNPTTQLEENGTQGGRAAAFRAICRAVSRHSFAFTCGEVGRQTCVPLLTVSRRIAFSLELRQQENRQETEGKRIAFLQGVEVQRKGGGQGESSQKRNT